MISSETKKERYPSKNKASGEFSRKHEQNQEFNEERCIRLFATRNNSDTKISLQIPNKNFLGATNFTNGSGASSLNHQKEYFQESKISGY